MRRSLEQSISAKRNAVTVKDLITAEDIGQLPDENIAEALQRVTGIQMSRDDNGEGASIQIRGISNNNVELNGEVLSGATADRAIDFRDIPSELFSAIEVLKTPTADLIEGSLGGTINLKTRRPLSGKKDFQTSLTLKTKYSEVSDVYEPDVSLFAKKAWRDTGFGDVGVIVNLTGKTVAGDAQTIDLNWRAREGSFLPPTGGGNVNATNANLFHPARGDGTYAVDENIDVNNDGVSDLNDRYIFFSSANFSARRNSAERKSLDTTFEYQPNESLGFYLQTTLTENDTVKSGSRYSIVTNGGRANLLDMGARRDVELLANTPALGEVYVVTAGRVSNASTRIGASPSFQNILNESQKYTFGTEWQIADTINFELEATTQEGKASTQQQAAITMGINYDGNERVNGRDFSQLYDYDFDAPGYIPNMTLYEAPFVAPNFGVTTQVSPDNLVAIAPNDIDYERLGFFQLNRVADDTTNTSDTLRFNFEVLLDSAISAVNFGYRYSDRGYKRQFWQTRDQAGNNPSTLIGPGEDPRQRINVQRIFVNPASNADPDIRAAAEFFQTCMRPEGDPDFLSDQQSNLPRTWTSSTGCTASDFETAFGLIPVRTVDPTTGIGFFESELDFYEVTETTNAFYGMIDFELGLAGLELFGNAGVRYVTTDTESTGLVAVIPNEYERTTIKGDYDDILPSANLNLPLTEEMILRIGAYRAIERPGLAQLAPRLNLNPTPPPEAPEFAGTGTAGNPDLDSIRANNIDISYEWYYQNGSLFSAALFFKDIDTTIARSPDRFVQDVNGELFLVEKPINLPGTEIKGLELALQHDFSNASGWMRHTGLGVNYTYIDEESEIIDSEGDQVERQGQSPNSYNITLFYDNKKFSTRLAYNWREEFVSNVSATLGNQFVFVSGEPGDNYVIPVMTEARGQLDLSANYQVTPNFKLNFSAVNLNESRTRRFQKYDFLTRFLADGGRRYNLGIIYKFQ